MKKIIINISLLISSFFLVLIILEIAVRLFLPQSLIYYNNDIWRDDSLFGNRHYENIDTYVSSGEQGKINFSTNEFGHRVEKNISEEIQINDMNVLVLGDSFIEAIQVSNEDTIPSILSRNIKSKTGLDVGFDNAAVAVWGPSQYYLESKNMLKQKHYDLGLIFLFLGNDIVDEFKLSFEPHSYTHPAKFLMPTSLDFSELKQKIFYPINDYFEVRSHLFIFSKRKLKTLFAKIGLTAYYFSDNYILEYEHSKKWDTTLDIAIAIQNEFKNQEAEAIFIFLPTNFQVHNDIFENYIEYFNINRDAIDIDMPNRILKSLFKKNNISFIDPLEYMRNNNNGNYLYEELDAHFNKAGQYIVAEYLLQYLISEIEKIKKN